MKFRIFVIFAIAFFLVGNAIGTENSPSDFPSASVPQPLYEFEPVVDGTQVIHDYIIQNKGTATLEIQKVKTSWGCTAVSYPRQIPPGGEGKISIEVDTSDKGGKRLKKKITVTTNDPKQEKIDLIVTGMVDRLVTIKPRRIRLTGAAGQPVKTEILILPEKKYPFKIVDVSADDGENIHFTYREIKMEDGANGYILTVLNDKPDKGRYVDKIILKTTSKYRPTINLHVTGYIS